MRDINRIDKFCNELAELWKNECPDWRFGQLMMNVFGEMSYDGIDPFFPEEDRMMEYFKKFFKVDAS